MFCRSQHKFVFYRRALRQTAYTYIDFRKLNFDFQKTKIFVSEKPGSRRNKIIENTKNMENDSKKRRRELETRIIEKVGEVITAVKNANRVDEVICALHSIASLLFPIDSCLLSGLSRKHSIYFLKFQLLNSLFGCLENVGKCLM